LGVEVAVVEVVVAVQVVVVVVIVVEVVVDIVVHFVVVGTGTEHGVSLLIVKTVVSHSVRT
jgi:hypothetical protein